MDQHIMISYNHKSAGNLAKQINEKLKENNYNTWVDYEKMKGYIYDAMADGIDKAFVVLVFVTDEYCKSPNCIKECEYATRKGKQVIPIKVTTHFDPSCVHGIVGITVGGILYIDFSGPDFDVSMNQLLDQIKKCEQQVINAINQTIPTPPSSENGKNFNLSYIKTFLINNKRLSFIIALIAIIILTETIVIIVSFSTREKCILDTNKKTVQIKEIEFGQTEFRYSLKISNNEFAVYYGARNWNYVKDGQIIDRLQELKRDNEGIIVKSNNGTFRLSSLTSTVFDPQPRWIRSRWNNVWKETKEERYIYPIFNSDWIEIFQEKVYTQHVLITIDGKGDSYDFDQSLRINSSGLFAKYNSDDNFKLSLNGSWINKL